MNQQERIQRLVAQKVKARAEGKARGVLGCVPCFGSAAKTPRNPRK